MKYLNNKQAKNLFEKYLKGNCTPKEKKLVESYLDSYQQGSEYQADINFKLDIEDQLWDRIKVQTLSKGDLIIRPLFYRKWIAYAAIFTGVVVMSLFSYLKNGNKNVSIDIGEDVIVLQTDKGENEIEDYTDGEIVDKSGNVIASLHNGILNYKKNTSNSKLVFNEIDVPLGKTFRLVLSDGTLVHLNAGSHLRFPIGFHPDKNREVYLSGEAYFEVTKKESNPFIVQANDMEVTVLGTHFNVSSYKGEPQHTVLIEGSVSVNNQKTDLHEIIKPGQKAIMADSGLTINDVDVKDYIGWTQDILTFSDELFPNIIKKIERRYNVAIVNNCPELDSARFNGKFRNESIISLMNTFKESANFEYEIEKGKIVINKKNSL